MINIHSTIVSMGFFSGRLDLPIVTNSNSYLFETKEILAKMGNCYNPEPIDCNASLDESHVLNDFWKKLRTQSKEEKDAMLQKIAALNFTDKGYPLARYHFAAGVLIGANPNVNDYCRDTLIYKCALHKDFALCKMLLEKGACPNNKGAMGYPIFNATTVPFAQLLLEHGASVNVLTSAGYNLIANAMVFDCEPELITLYKSKGLSSLYTSSYFNGTALHALALRGNEYQKDIPKLYSKVNALFQGLNQAEIIQLIQTNQKFNGTVFDILKDQNRAGSNALKNILQKYLEQGSSLKSETEQKSDDIEECCICSDQLTIQNPPAHKLPCGHNQFCVHCIEQWKKMKEMNQTCPLCRQVI